MSKNYDQAGLLNDAANLQEYGLSERQILAAQAQAAATLALAYEQRTANLIALMADESMKADAERFGRRFPDGAGVEISALIRERLGLA